MGYIYSPHTKLVVGAVFQPWRLAVDRPGRRPTVKNLTVGAFRSTARSTVPIHRANALWPIDRSVDRPSLTVDRSVDRPHPRVGYLQSVDRSVDRPKWLASVHVLCTSIDRSDRSTLGPVDRQSLAGSFSGLETWVLILK